MKKFFTILLSVVMVMAMMPSMVFAEVESDFTLEVIQSDGSYEMSMDSGSGINNMLCQDDESTFKITLNKDVSEKLVIPSGVECTIDLNGFTLSNLDNENTIENNGILTIIDSSEAQTGSVICNANGKQPLVKGEGSSVESELTIDSNGVNVKLETINISNSEELADAIVNQKLGQTWILADGVYTLTEELMAKYESITINGENEFVFPIIAKGLTIKAQNPGKVTVTSDFDPGEVMGGVWHYQNFMTVAAQGVTINGVDIKANPNSYNGEYSCNKAIEVLAPDFQLINSTIIPLESEIEGTTVLNSGSIYFNTSSVGTNTKLENVTLSSWISGRAIEEGNVELNNITMNYVKHADAEYVGEDCDIIFGEHFNNNGITVKVDSSMCNNLNNKVPDGTVVTVQVTEDVTLTEVPKEGITLKLDEGVKVTNNTEEPIKVSTPAGTVTIEKNQTVTAQPAPQPPAGGGYYDPLATPKKDAVKAVEDSVVLADYDAAEQAVIKDILAKAKKDIEAAKTKEEIEALTAAAKAELDKVLTTAEKEEAAAAEKTAKLIAGVQATTFRAWSEADKGYIRVKWDKSYGYKMDYVEVYKAKSKAELKASTKPYFETKSGTWKSYKNTKGLKKGTKYYYRVRGVREINGQKYYTEFSTMAYRFAK